MPGPDKLGEGFCSPHLLQSLSTKLLSDGRKTACGSTVKAILVEYATERMKEYLGLLCEIYGKNIVEHLTNRVSKTAIKLKEPRHIEHFINKLNEYVEPTHDGVCSRCSKKPRKMDFPSWLGSLDFKNKHAKQMMIIGESVSPKVRKGINIAYGLGRYDICTTNGWIIDPETGKTVEEERRNYLWHRLLKISNNRLDLITKNTYVTDISKCNARKRKEIWKECSKNFLKREIKLINPKIVLFQGNTAYNFTKSLPGIEMIEDSKYNKNFPKFGTIKIQNEEIKFLKIYHSALRAERWWRKKEVVDEFKDLMIKLLHYLQDAR